MTVTQPITERNQFDYNPKMSRGQKLDPHVRPTVVLSERVKVDHAVSSNISSIVSPQSKKNFPINL